MFQDFPSLHPLAVHFPIVLILLTVPFQAMMVWKNWVQIKWVTLGLMGLAFLSSLAVSTIFHAHIAEDAPGQIMTVFLQHEKYARYTLWLSGFTLVLKGIGDFYKIQRRSYQIVVLASALLTAIFLSISGHHGAALVHIEGVGPKGKYLMVHDDSEPHSHSTSDEHESDVGEDSEHNEDDHHHEMDSISETQMNGHEMEGENSSTMDHSNGKMETMDHGEMQPKNGKMETMDHGEMQPKNGKMETMDHGEMQPKNGKANVSNHNGMNHQGSTIPSTTKEVDPHTNHEGVMNENVISNEHGMPMPNPMDTFKFRDNNPARKKPKAKTE